jgi:Tfp pilus assembly protein PilO
MPKKPLLGKKAQILQANNVAVIWACVAAFVLAFTAISAYKLIGQIAYQNKVLGAKKTALDQLDANLAARDDLVDAYQVFNSGAQNAIGGNPAGTGERDGDNAKIMLDALPSVYDFPQLATSIETLAVSQGVVITSMTGVDDQVTQSQQTGSAQPQAVAMPFTVAVEGPYAQVQSFVRSLELSIRPIKVTAASFTSGDGKVTAAITAESQYQPARKFQVEKKVQE